MEEQKSATVIVPTNADLHRLMDQIKGHLDGMRSDREGLVARFDGTDSKLAEAIRQLEASEQKWKAVEARVDAMDKLLPRGPDKRYIPIDGSKPNSELHERMARFFLDGMCYATKKITPFGSDEFKRAIDDVGQTIAGDGSQGGHLVPPEFRQEILRIAGIYGIARRIFRIMPIARQTMYMPTHVSGPEVQWVDEAEAPTDETHVRFGRFTLEVKRLMAIDNLSIEITEDSIPMITDFIVEVFAEVIAKEEDRVGLLGDAPTDPFDGVVNTAGINVVYMGGVSTSGATTMDDVTYDDLVNTLDAVNEFVADQGQWIASNSMFNALRKVKDGDVNPGNGRPLWTEMVAGNPGTILGRPYLRSAVMQKRSDTPSEDKPVLLYGDFRKTIMAQRKEMEISFSEHADFRRGNIVMRLMERVGFGTPLPDAFAVLKTAAS